MTAERVIVSLVEGHGEVEAVPVLIRRVADMLQAVPRPQVSRPIRVPKARLLKESALERYLALASARVKEGGGVLILLDADETCPAEEAPELMTRVQDVLQDIPFGVVLAKHEFETWFLAGATSLRGKRRIPRDFNGPSDPEAIRGAKEQLSKSMPRSSPYSPPVDQAALMAALDLELARSRSHSFDKCCREIARLIGIRR